MTDSMKLRVRLAAPITTVHHALTDADVLRVWLAEHAAVELPDRYEFWGRYTPEGDVPHQRPLHVDDHTVRFAWRLGGEDTTVEINLEEESPESTILSLTQSHFPDWRQALEENNIRGVLHTYWSLSIANLVDHVEGRELTPKCDFTSPVMREQVLIAAAPGTVYDSLIDPEQFRRWFGANVGIEPYVGGRFAMGGFDLDLEPAKIIELEPSRKLSMAWSDGTVASWELAESGGKTRLTFVQSGFDQQKPPYGAWMGWLSGVAELRRYHELPDWRPVWLEVAMPGMPDGMLTIDQ
ncbi:MAG TPA: SRPBCC family protein [Pilimelia sp.]|nr:SRPBCC family protein [Pilimelia sp.]